MARILFALLLPLTVVCADENELTQRQAGVAERYGRLEELLLRLADMEAAENPERSALLRRAARQSRDKFILEKLRIAATSLQNDEFQKAVENQSAAGQELDALLTLLMSEDRSQRIRDEKERYQALMKDLKRNLNNQRSTRARTENQADLEEVQQEQQAVTKRSQELQQRLGKDNQPPAATDQQDAADAAEASDPSDPSEPSRPPTEQQSTEQQSTEQQSTEGEPTEGEPTEQEPTEGPASEGQPAESQPAEQQPAAQPPAEASPADSAPSQSPASPPQQSQSSESPESPPTAEQEVEQRLQQAIEKMRQAEAELERAQREAATEQQRQAEANLRAAIDRLERILRQLREEEMQRELARLEARLRKMAAMQTKVLDDTVALAATPPPQRNRQTDLKAGNLAFEEKKITLEADRAMLLLREEGSSVAFPEVIDQIRTDTTTVAERLASTQIDAVTQGIQQDILAALEEMISALQKAQRDLEQQRQQAQPGQSGQPGQQEQPLVESLAELKLIRTMETRIKATTERYGNLLDSGGSSPDDLLPLLQNLAERQNRLFQVTRDLVLKRNQ